MCLRSTTGRRPLPAGHRPLATGHWPPIALLAAALAASGCGAPPPAPASAGRDAVDVAVVSAVRGDIEATLEISGSLAPARRVGVTAKAPGRLERVLVDLGDRVAAGATLATLERQDAAAAADQAAAAAGAVLVPREAVGARGDRRIVLVVDGDRVRVTEVTVGISGDRFVQIVSGVSEGQLVVADARRDVAPDVRVKPIGR